MVQEFISEDDLKTFDGWLEYQAIDAKTTPPEELATWRRVFDESRERSAAVPKVGLMKLQPVVGEYRYAVAVQDGSDLWLTLWVRRSRKGEFFIMTPCGDRDWNPHTSYHFDGTFHAKSHDYKVLPRKRQPLTKGFKGTEPLGVYYGYAPKSVGAICDPAVFSGIVVLAPDVLGPRDGGIAVDLVEPNHEPLEIPWTRIVTQQFFRDFQPWLVITVGL